MTGEIIAVAQTKGGSGKTTLAVHLAVALSRTHTVALLDIDPQGSLGEWYERREQRLGEAGTGLDFRTASGWGAKREARNLARDNQIVIIDTPPKSDLEARHAIDTAAIVAIPVQPTPVDMWATRATLELVGHGGAKALIVLNRVPSRSRITDEMAAAIADLGCGVAEARLGNRVSYAAAMGLGSTVTELAGDPKATEEVFRLVDEIRRLVPG